MCKKKADKNRTRFLVVGDHINYLGEAETPKADMLMAQILFNSLISKRGAKFTTMNISDFYLITPLKKPEYIHIIIKDIPEEIITVYKPRNKAEANGSV